MPERPIIFSGPMVRAILAGRKTQTRRLAHMPPRVWLQTGDAPPEPCLADSLWTKAQPGDRLWVRETWTPCSTYVATPIAEIPRDAKIMYPADASYWPSSTPIRPSIHMPRWASRLTLKVTAVRRQRLHDLDEADVLAEGLIRWPADDSQPADSSNAAPFEPSLMWNDRRVDPRQAFGCLWNSLHAKPGTTWADNPEVVAIAFRRIDIPAEASRGRRDA